MKRRLASFLACALVAGCIGGCSGMTSTSGRQVPDVEGNDGGPARSPRRRAAAAHPAAIPLLSLDNLTPSAVSKDEPPRNLFAFEQDPAVLAKKKEEAEKAAKAAAEAAKEAQAQQQKRTEELRKNPPPPAPPQVTINFVGYFGHPDSRIGVFVSRGAQDVILAKKGDTVMSKYKILNIGYESAEIGFQGFKQTERIPLSGGGK